MADTATPPQVDQIEGRARTRVTFEELDQRFNLKMRAFINTCMAPIFADMEKHLSISALRRQGIAPIMFYLIFENSSKPLVFHGDIESRHSIRLRRSVSPDPKNAGGKQERLMLEMHSEVWGTPGSGDPSSLGADAKSGTLERVGTFRGLHVITKPVAPANERQVTVVPPEMSRLREAPYDKPFPTPELISEAPAGFKAVDLGQWEQFTSIWGLPNTDINHHVNVKEYIFGMENQFTRMLYAAKLPVVTHRIAKAHFLFRKPGFPGDLYAIRAKLYTQGNETALIGSFHQAGPEGQVDPKPSVAVRMEGVFEGAAPAKH